MTPLCALPPPPPLPLVLLAYTLTAHCIQNHVGFDGHRRQNSQHLDR
jgi:hypothetical protein